MPAVVALHLRAFQGFFLSFLGARFLTVLYRSLLSDRRGVALVAERDGALLGFAAGTYHLPGLYTALLKKHVFEFALASIGPLLTSPRIARRLLRALSSSREARTARYPASLMSIAVDPRQHAGGVGDRLLSDFCAQLRAGGAEGCSLTTDETDNAPVCAFYERRGWAPQRTFVTPEGRRMCEYARDLHESGSANLREGLTDAR